MCGLADSMYSLWESTVLSKLCDGENAGCGVATESNVDHGLHYNTLVHQSIKSMFQFCAVRMISTNENVRFVASKYCELMLLRFPWLYCDQNSVFTVLDVVTCLCSESSNACAAASFHCDKDEKNGIQTFALPINQNNDLPLLTTLNPWLPEFKKLNIANIVEQRMQLVRIAEQVIMFAYKMLLPYHNIQLSHSISSLNPLSDIWLRAVLQNYVVESNMGMGYEIAKELSINDTPNFHNDISSHSVSHLYTPTSKSFASAIMAFSADSDIKSIPITDVLTIIRRSCSAAAEVLLTANKKPLYASSQVHEKLSNELLLKNLAVKDWTEKYLIVRSSVQDIICDPASYYSTLVKQANEMLDAFQPLSSRFKFNDVYSKMSSTKTRFILPKDQVVPYMYRSCVIISEMNRYIGTCLNDIHGFSAKEAELRYLAKSMLRDIC